MRNALVGLALILFAAVAGCSGGSVVPADAGSTVCRSDRDCSASGGVCNRTTGYCVQCLSATDCTSGQACRAGTCTTVTPCTSSRMCSGLVCDTMRGYCVDCVTDADCHAPQTCRDDNCIDPPSPCTSDRDCSSIGLVCSTTMGHCVECIRDADCPTDRFCGAAGSCVPTTCHAGATMCASTTTIATCLPNGSGYSAPMACAMGSTCTGTSCTAPMMDAAMPRDMGIDLGSDMGIDSGTDAGIDAGTDMGVDAGPDVGADATPSFIGNYHVEYPSPGYSICPVDPAGAPGGAATIDGYFGPISFYTDRTWHLDGSVTGPDQMTFTGLDADTLTIIVQHSGVNLVGTFEDRGTFGTGTLHDCIRPVVLTHL